jgi:hypothetical protein
VTHPVPYRNALMLSMTLLLVWIPSAESAQPVISRTRLGNETEDMEVIASGRYAGLLAMMDGLDVIGLPVRGSGHGRDKLGRHDDHGEPRVLFNVKRLQLNTTPRGIAYVESERLFVFDDPTHLDRLLFSDEHGNPAGSRTITFPAGYVPGFAEALAYIPRDSSFFPDHILQVGYDADFFSHILIINRNGNVEADIVPDDPAVQDNGLVALSFVSADRFLVSVARNTVFLLDLSGHTVTGPVIVPEVGPGSGIEGVGEIRAGYFVATDHDTGRVYALDSDLQRVERADQSFTVGVGLSGASGPAWNPDTRSFLFFDYFADTLDAVSVSADRKRVLADPTELGLDGQDVGDLFYQRHQHLIGITSFGSQPPFLRGFAFLDNAAMAQGTITTTGIIGRPARAQYFDATGQYGVIGTAVSSAGTIAVLDSDGTLVRSIDLKPYIGAVRPRDFAYFNPAHPSGGELLVVTSTTALVLDLSGTLITTFDYRASLDMQFGAEFVTAITTGPLRGAFAAHASGTNELVLFRLTDR